MSATQVTLPEHLMLYRHFLQENGTGIRGLDLRSHFLALGRLNRCVRLEDDEVEDWIFNPVSYPEELKNKKVLLLTSNSIGTLDCATSLEWQGGKVGKVPAWLQNIFNGEYYVLLRRHR